MKKSVFFMFLFLLGTFETFACEVCEKNQPKPLRGITHGVGPTGNLDYIITIVAAIIVSITLFLSIKYLVKPKEGNVDHIKNIVLDEN